MISKHNISRPKRPASQRPESHLPDFGSGEEFDALDASDKERVAKFYEQGRHRPQMRPLTAAERAELKKDRAGLKGGRLKVEKTGVKVISLSVELKLLKRADAYAKAHGLNRAELVTQALNKLLPAGA